MCLYRVFPTGGGGGLPSAPPPPPAKNLLITSPPRKIPGHLGHVNFDFN